MNKLWSHLKIKVIKIKCKWGEEHRQKTSDPRLSAYAEFKL